MKHVIHEQHPAYKIFEDGSYVNTETGTKGVHKNGGNMLKNAKGVPVKLDIAEYIKGEGLNWLATPEPVAKQESNENGDEDLAAAMAKVKAEKADAANKVREAKIAEYQEKIKAARQRANMADDIVKETLLEANPDITDEQVNVIIERRKGLPAKIEAELKSFILSNLPEADKAIANTLLTLVNNANAAIKARDEQIALIKAGRPNISINAQTGEIDWNANVSKASAPRAPRAENSASEGTSTFVSLGNDKHKSIIIDCIAQGILSEVKMVEKAYGKLGVEDFSKARNCMHPIRVALCKAAGFLKENGKEDLGAWVAANCPIKG